jgi:hypothetical protein
MELCKSTSLNDIIIIQMRDRVRTVDIEKNSRSILKVADRTL